MNYPDIEYSLSMSDLSWYRSTLGSIQKLHPSMSKITNIFQCLWFKWHLRILVLWFYELRNRHVYQNIITLLKYQ